MVQVSAVDEDEDDPFWSSDAGQFLGNAHRYLSAARELRWPAGKEDGKSLHLVPILHLIAHGAELLLKYPLLRSGQSQAEVRKAYGHRLRGLWLAPGTASLRAAMNERAAKAWRDARDSGDWPNDDFTDDPRAVLAGGIRKLAFAHDTSSNFALRYSLPKGGLNMPRPAFLIEVLQPVAEDLCRDPGLLDRWYSPTPAIARES